MAQGLRITPGTHLHFEAAGSKKSNVLAAEPEGFGDGCCVHFVVEIGRDLS